MPILDKDGNRYRPYEGDHRPLNIFDADSKIEGWHEVAHTDVTEVSVVGTYNDSAEVTVKGNTVQVSDWYAKDGLSSQYQDTKTIGKNLFNREELEQGGTFEGSGAPYTMGSRVRTKPISVAASTTYYLKNNSSYIKIRNVNSFKADGTFISTVYGDNILSETQFITPALCAYVIITFCDSTTYAEITPATVYVENIQLEKSSVATPYEPYKEIIKSGLVMELSGRNFFNDPPTSLLQDRSGNGNVGTPSGFAYIAESGSDGAGGIAFDGVNDIITVPDDATLNLGTGAFTINVNYTSKAGTRWAGAISKGGLWETSGTWMLRQGEENLLFEAYINNTRVTAQSTLSNSIGAKQDLCLVVIPQVDLLSIDWYRDGAFVETTNTVVVGTPTFDTTLPITLGQAESSYKLNCTLYVARIYNRALSASEIYQNYFAGVHLQVPSPDDASPIISNLKAGTYKYTSTDGIYEFTLTEELRGIGTAVDKVVFDRISHAGNAERRCGKYTFTGNESLLTVETLNEFFYVFTNTNVMDAIVNESGLSFCTHFKTKSALNASLAIEECMSVTTEANYQVRFSIRKTIASTVAGFKVWLASNPVTVVYQLANPARTALTFTKVASSTAPEVPMAFLTSTPSLEYPAQVYDASGNLISRNEDSSQIDTRPLPTLRKVGAVADEYNPVTGKLLKKISDWFTLDGSKYWAFIARYGAVLRVDAYNALVPMSVNYTGVGYNFDSTPLVPSSGFTLKDRITSYGNAAVLSIDSILAGFGELLTPSTNEIKAYFYGWKMCNADGTSPYYKSEVPYTPSTWAEWTKDVGVVGDATGLQITSDGTNYIDAKAPMTYKVSTKYGILYSVVASNLTQNLILRTGPVGNAFAPVFLSKSLGNNKSVLTTNAVLTDNVFWIYVGTTEPSGNAIKLKDIRIFELPAGSQIETDFNTLTADQLAAKYTFNGLCPKNWKHLVGNQTDIDASKTALLPTASYAGYTPYKMLYQLATPVEMDYGVAGEVPTYYPSTVIEPDSINAIPTMDVTVRVEDL